MTALCSTRVTDRRPVRRGLILQRHFVIMGVRGFVGGNGRIGRWLGGAVAIVTSSAAGRVRATAGAVR
jgi:hypothetical protein